MRPAAPDLSCVIVNHRSAERCRACVESLRRAFVAENLRGEIILVDCASGSDEVAQLRRLAADRLLALPENRGYSGGLNAGIAEAHSRRFLLCNADVEFPGGALRPLLEAAGDPRVGAAAPVQMGDRDERIYLPTGFASRFGRDLFHRRWRGRAFRRWALLQRRLWLSGGVAPHLAGSILAVSRTVLDHAGRFDERFQFEYEETEWEDRVVAAGYRLVAVATARALHFHGGSSSRSPGVAARAAASRQEYRRRRYGLLGSALLRRAERVTWEPPVPAFTGEEIAARGEDFWLAVSPAPSLLPFAGVSLVAPIRVEQVLQSTAPSLFAAIFDARRGRVVERFRLARA